MRTPSVMLALIAAAGCGHGHDHAPESTPERPVVAVTRWSDATELFLEYPMLVAGETSRFAVHLTSLETFRPLTEGRAVVRLSPPAGPATEFVTVPSRPGIFGGDVVPAASGRFEMTLVVDAPPIRDEHPLGAVEVLPAGSAIPVEAQDEGGGIPFLKEQQWTLDFATETVTQRPIAEGIVVPAEVRARVGGDVVLRAPAAGRMDVSVPVRAPGSPVRRGEVVAIVVAGPSGDVDGATLRRALVDAEQELVAAERETGRAERLTAAGAAPERRVDEARASVVRARARLEEARDLVARHEQVRGSASEDGRFVVRAPFDGVVAEAHAVPGALAQAGDVLARIVDADAVEIVAAVPESEAASLPRATGAEVLFADGSVRPLGRPVAGRVVDPASRSVEARVALDNRDRRLAVGQTVRMRLLIGEPREAPSVPVAAIVDDGGRPVVFEQIDGESFERRPVTLGASAGGYVEVVNGVAVGARVVSRGAHLLRLASLSTQVPSHGHVH